MNIKHNKEDILRKGMELFRLNGYHNTGTNEILRETGISRGSFYNFFKDKDDFGIQVLDYYGVWSTDYISEVLTDERINPKQRLIHLFEVFVQGYKRENYKWGCLLVGMTQEMGQIHPAFTNACERNFEDFVGVFKKCIEEGQKSKDISAKQDARGMALTILSMYNGALVLMKSGMHQEPLDAFLEQLNLILTP